MSRIMSISPKFITPRLIHFQEQPRFPHEDLTPNNAAYLSHHLSLGAGRLVMRDMLFDSQHGLYRVALDTEPHGELRVEDSQESYMAFTSGFSLYRSIVKATQTARAESLMDGAAAAQDLLIHRSPDIAAMKLGHVHTRWQDKQPNAFGVIADAHKELPGNNQHAASMGAAVAYRLSFDI